MQNMLKIAAKSKKKSLIFFCLIFCKRLLCTAYIHTYVLKLFLALAIKFLNNATTFVLKITYVLKYILYLHSNHINIKHTYKLLK